MPKKENEILFYTPELRELNAEINKYKLRLKELRKKLKLYVQEQKYKGNNKKNSVSDDDDKEFLILRMD